MGFLKTGMQLLDFIEAGEYKKAVDYLDAIEDGNEVYEIVLDLLARVGLCFGVEENGDLVQLMQRLFRFSTLKERAVIVRDLFHQNTSPQLYRVLIAVLVVDYDALDSKNKDEFRTLPQQLEDKLLDYIEEHEDQVVVVAQLCGHLFSLANYVGSKYWYDPLVDTIVRSVDPCKAEMAAVLVHLGEQRPFHPVLYYAMEKSPKESPVAPFVFSPLQIIRGMTRELTDYLNLYVKVDNSPLMANVSTVVLQSLITHVGIGGIRHELAEEFLNLFEKLLPISLDLDLGEVRVKIMRQFVRILDSFDFVPRCLILKRLIHLICKQQIRLSGEAQVLAWMLDLYKRHFAMTIYKDELTAVWGLVMDVRYEDPIEATAFYVSAFCLAQMQAICRYNTELMKDVKEKFLDRVHLQIVDYVNLQEAKAKAKAQEKNENDEESVYDMDVDTKSNLTLITTTLEMTRNYVNTFVGSS